MDKGFENIYKWPTKANEKMLNIISHLRNANQNEILHIHYDEYHQKERITSDKNIQKLEPSSIAGGNAKWCGCFGK